jgi:hypothetical protein
VRSRLALLGLFVVASASACRRQAPGPDECRKLALAAAGVERREDLRSPLHLEQLDALTRECLVTPYDRTFVRCMEETRHYATCRRDFTRRRAALAEPAAHSNVSRPSTARTRTVAPSPYLPPSSADAKGS